MEKKIRLIILLLITSTLVYSQNNFRAGFCERSDSDSPKSFSIALGYGTSFGGYGIQSGIYLTPKKRVGINLGVGDYFGDVFVNGGVKFYLFDNLYLNPIYGYFGRIYSYEYDVNSDVVEKKHYLIGPGIFIGYDWFFSKRFGLNLGAGINYDHKFNQEFLPAFDLGFFVGF